MPAGRRRISPLSARIAREGPARVLRAAIDTSIANAPTDRVPDVPRLTAAPCHAPQVLKSCTCVQGDFIGAPARPRHSDWSTHCPLRLALRRSDFNSRIGGQEPPGAVDEPTSGRGGPGGVGCRQASPRSPCGFGERESLPCGVQAHSGREASLCARMYATACVGRCRVHVQLLGQRWRALCSDLVISFA